MKRRVPVLFVGAVFTACQAGSPALPPLPDGNGAGVVMCDAAAPAGAQTWARPQWRKGDRFAYVRGGVVPAALEVANATATHYAFGVGNGVELRRDLDLGNLGEWGPDGEPLHVLSPVDVRYHWPLWVGKRWSCEFVDRMRGGEGIALRVDYAVEDLDVVTVPAGTFQALRITRSARRTDSDKFLPRWQVAWYSPELGTEVRYQNGDTLVELVERPAQH